MLSDAFFVHAEEYDVHCAEFRLGRYENITIAKR